MLRRLLLPALAVALFAAEAASAQVVPAATAATAAIPTKTEARQTARAARRTGRVLTNREKRAAAAVAKAEAAATAAPALAWGGSGPDALPASTRTTPANRTDMAWSSAPGMPLNQVGHGVTTDYDGRPVKPKGKSGTTLGQ